MSIKHKRVRRELFSGTEPMETIKSILEGVWNGIVVSGVMTVCVLLARSAATYFLA